MQEPKSVERKFIERVNSFIKTNKNYILVDVAFSAGEKPSFLILKKKDLIVKTVYDNNIFQPHEKEEEKTYLCAIILSYNIKKIPISFKSYINLGCPVVNAKEKDNIIELLKEF